MKINDKVFEVGELHSIQSKQSNKENASKQNNDTNYYDLDIEIKQVNQQTQIELTGTKITDCGSCCGTCGTCVGCTYGSCNR